MLEHTHTHQFSQSGQSRSRSWPITQCPMVRTRGIRSHGDRQGQSADFRDNLERIKRQYLLFNCGIKTKPHIEWVLRHWSSLCQLNWVPTDLVRISVKEAMHMGFIIESPNMAAVSKIRVKNEQYSWSKVLLFKVLTNKCVSRVRWDLLKLWLHTYLFIISHQKSASLQSKLSTHGRQSILGDVEGYKDPISGEKVV